MSDYVSQFTGQEIDQRLAKVSQLETDKQDVLVSGTNIKTINGQSVLGGGNIQVQAGDTDAVKYVAQTLTDAQKAQARANIDAASLEDINDMDFVTAASLPTASASTMGHIYLIGPDANNNYDRYFTQESGGAYSWVSLGSTQIDLSTYATKSELTQLEAEVDGLSRTIVTDIVNNKIADKTVTTLGVNAFVTDIELKSGKSYLIYVKSPGAVDNSNTGVWIKVGNSYTKIESLTASQYYDGVYLDYTPDSDCLLCVRPYAVTTVLIKVWDLSIPATLASLNEAEIINSIASEAFQYSSFVYADGLVSSATIKWSDGVVGTMSITYTNGLPTSVSYTHGTDTYAQTITYASDGSVTNTSIAKQ